MDRGASIVGKRLVGHLGGWSGTSPYLYGFQWQRCKGRGCTDIVGATANSYRITSSDVDTRLRVRVTARNGTGAASASSDKLGPVVVSAQELKALLQRQIKPHGRAATLGGVLASGHYAFVFEAPEAGTLPASGTSADSHDTGRCLWRTDRLRSIERRRGGSGSRLRSRKQASGCSQPKLAYR